MISLCDMYQVEWPIDIFFPKVLLNTYNQIFIFLLQVKFAKWCLLQIDIGSKIYMLNMFMYTVKFEDCASMYLFEYSCMTFIDFISFLPLIDPCHVLTCTCVMYMIYKYTLHVFFQSTEVEVHTIQLQCIDSYF